MKFISSIQERLKIALHALKTNKLRAFLTTLCIIIGITMVTVVDTVTTGMDKTFDDSMAMLGQNVVYIEKWPWDGDGLTMVRTTRGSIRRPRSPTNNAGVDSFAS